MTRPTPELQEHNVRTMQEERFEILKRLESWLEIPMLVLAFAWLALLVVELLWGESHWFESIGIAIWITFILNFALEFVIAPQKLAHQYDLEALIAQQLAAVYLANLGSDDKPIPHWFAEGCGRVVSTRLADGGDRRIAQWDVELSGIVGSLSKPDDFLTGKLPQELSDVCSFSFAKMLMTDTRRFGNLMDNLRKDAEFKAAFSAAYAAPPEQLAGVWVRNPPRAGKGRAK